MTLAALNALDRAGFVQTLGSIFEASPWVAERVADQRPFADTRQLHRAMTAAVSDASPAEQLALLRAHPDLGSRSRMSEASVGEQASAGLDRLTGDDLEQLRRLNDAYRLKFGFPFLWAVKGRRTAEVLDALRRRVERAPDEELAEALAQVARIAWFRIEALIDE